MKNQHPCYIIAEAGVNHNGSEELALRLVEAAHAAGANAVKFQTFKTEKLVTIKAKKASYQAARTGDGGQFAMLKALELSEETHRRLADHCSKIGIEFLSTPFDEESADFLVQLGCRRIKIPSGELTNTPFLRFLASKGLPIILSTGMSNIDEVAEAVDSIAEIRLAHGHTESLQDALTLLHCTSNYPTPLADVNLLAMQTLAQRFKLPVGYSDHTTGTFVAPLARALGATVFEKHFTLDRDLPGPDHSASLEPDELARMVQAIHDTDAVIGSGIKTPTAAELEVRIAARRSVTIARDLPVGVAITARDLTLMRPGDGIAPVDLDRVIGRTLCQPMQVGDTLRWEHLA